MQTIWLAYLVAATTASVLFVAAGFRRSQAISTVLGRPDQRVERRTLALDPEAAREQPLGDAAECIHMALGRLASLTGSQSTHVDVAARHGLLVRLCPPVLTDLLEDVIATALHNAPASDLLVTASAHGDRIHITVSDDIPNADLAVRQSQVRHVQERIALSGGTLDVQVRPAEGTLMTLRLLAAFEAPADESLVWEQAPPAGAFQLL